MRERRTKRFRTRGPRRSDADDVEEQLRKQRLERQQQQQQDQLVPAHEDGSRAPPPIRRPPVVRPVLTLGRFVWDPNRDAYFPRGQATTMIASSTTDRSMYITEEKCQLNRQGSSRDYHPYATIPNRGNNLASYYGWAAELCHRSSVRHRIVTHWRGHVLLAGASTSPIQEPTPIVDVYSAPNRRGFAAFATATSESVFWVSADPSINIAMGTTRGCLRSRTTGEIESMQSYDTVRDASSIKQNTLGDVAILSDRYQSVTRIKYSDRTCFPLQITRRNYLINDFAIHPDNADVTALAHDKGRWCLNQSDRIAIVQSRHYSLSPKSDILAVEIWNERDAVICGHRNGQLSLGDLRTGATAWHSPPDRPFGNVASLRPLDGRFSFLAKSYSGVCRLYDARKADGPLFAMATPSGTAGCKGMTTDQGNSLWINAVPTKVGGGCALEVWSLRTGEFIHSRIVAAGDRPCELCSTTTPNRHNTTSLWIAQHEGRLLRINLEERYLVPDLTRS